MHADASDCHLMHDVWQAALKRLQLEYVDLVFCHRPDPFTPIEETVRALNFVNEQGWAFYWGTSEWTGQQITEVHDHHVPAVKLPTKMPSVAWSSNPVTSVLAVCIRSHGKVTVACISEFQSVIHRN